MSPAFINRLIVLFWKLKKNDDLKVTSRTLIDKYQMEQYSYYIKQKQFNI